MSLFVSHPLLTRCYVTAVLFYWTQLNLSLNLYSKHLLTEDWGHFASVFVLCSSLIAAASTVVLRWGEQNLLASAGFLRAGPSVLQESPSSSRSRRRWGQKTPGQTQEHAPTSDTLWMRNVSASFWYHFIKVKCGLGHHQLTGAEECFVTVFWSKRLWLDRKRALIQLWSAAAAMTNITDIFQEKLSWQGRAKRREDLRENLGKQL